MSEQIDSNKMLKSFLKTNKDDHYNFEEEVDYKVSSGSLQFDLQLGGGFGPGLHRFVGMNEGGKTSESLEVMRNFLKTIPKSKGVYVKAEGRLSPEMRERSGVKFVYDPDEWVDGTCFVFESNIYETVVGLMRELVTKNDDKIKYCFALDSVDGLILKNDMDKSFEDATKVAGGAVVAAKFMQRMSIALAKRGHMAIFVSQNPSIKQMDSQKNPAIGHYAKVTVKKSPNEKTNTVISYPIRYGRKNGTSIWVEKEIVDLLYAWEFVSKSGAWISFTDDFKEILSDTDFELPDKVQGDNKLFALIEENKSLSLFLVEYFKNAIQELS